MACVAWLSGCKTARSDRAYRCRVRLSTFSNVARRLLDNRSACSPQHSKYAGFLGAGTFNCQLSTLVIIKLVMSVAEQATGCLVACCHHCMMRQWLQTVHFAEHAAASVCASRSLWHSRQVADAGKHICRHMQRACAPLHVHTVQSKQQCSSRRSNCQQQSTGAVNTHEVHTGSPLWYVCVGGMQLSCAALCVEASLALCLA